MGRKRQVMKTYGRHRQRVVTNVEVAKQETHHSVFSGSSDHLFSSSSSSASNLWDISNESSRTSRGKGRDQENQVFRKARESKLETSCSSNESVYLGRHRNAKRRALKDIKNGDVAGMELDERLKRKKKIINNNTMTRKDTIVTSAEGTCTSKIKSKLNERDSVMNFSEFEDYSLIISDSLFAEDENVLDPKTKLKRAHSTPAYNEQKGKKSRSESSTSTPFCKSLARQLSIESIQDHDLSHIGSADKTSNSDIFYSGLNSMTKEDMEESDIRHKLSLASDSLKQLHQSSLLCSTASPNVLSLRSGKSLHKHYSKPVSLNNSRSHSYLFRKSGSIQSVKQCKVNIHPLRKSLLKIHLENVLSKNDSRVSLTQATNNNSFQRRFNASDSLFSDFSLNDNSSRRKIIAERSEGSRVSSESLALFSENENQLNSTQSEIDQNKDPDETESYFKSGSDVDSDNSSSEENKCDSEAEDTDSSEQSDSDLEPGEVIVSRMNLRSIKEGRKVRFSGATDLNFSNSCYTLTEEGELNDWSTDDVTDQLANISIEDKGIEISDLSAYSTANSHISIISESEEEDLDEREVCSSLHTSNHSSGSERDSFSPKGIHQSVTSKALEDLQKSFSEMLTPIKKRSKSKSLCPRSKIFLQCEQTDYVPFSTSIPQDVMSSCVKIGEGVYGEVFRPQLSDPVAFKVIPIEGDFPVNDEAQKTFEEILPEIIISRELSALRDTQDNRTDNFVAVNRVSCVQGSYPRELLEQWDEYDRKQGSENDRPDKFGESQLFIMFEFADGGCDLESFKFKNILEIKSVLVQVAFALAVAEIELEFEHRDLHWGNVLVKRSPQETIGYSMQDSEQEIQAHGVHISIIDFTLSRLTKEGCTVFCDLSTDDTLYNGQGDYQFDIYRLMKEENGNNWEPFNPHTNILWLHYLVDKLTTKKRCTVRSKAHINIQRGLRLVKKSIMDYQSAYDLISHSEFFKS